MQSKIRLYLKSVDFIFDYV